MKMTKTEMNVAWHYIIERINRINYGMLSGGMIAPPCSMRDEFDFDKSGWRIDRNMDYIAKDDIPMYRIVAKYGKHGKMLKPKLEYIG